MKPGPRPALKSGVYRHYKGNKYRVMGLVCHSEELEWYVLYERLYDSDSPKMWIRPYEMFTSSVMMEGKELPRFKFVKDTVDDAQEPAIHDL